MSPAFAYQYGNDYNVFDVLKNRGSVDLAEVPFDPLCGEPLPTSAQLEAAKPFRIKDTLELWNYGPAAAPYTNDPAKVVMAKTRLANSYVLSIGVNTAAGDFPDNDQNPPAVFYDPPGKPTGTGHCEGIRELRLRLGRRRAQRAGHR